MEGCPYCRKVRECLEENKMEFEKINVYPGGGQDEEDRKLLIELTGQNLVPVLVYNGEAMTGSDDIVTFLSENSSS